MPKKNLSDHVGSGEPDSKLQAKIRHLEAEKRQLQKRLDESLESIDRHKAAGFKLPKAKRGNPRGVFVRLVVPDTHGSRIDKRAAAAMLADMDYLQPAEVILLGDHADVGGFLAQHHVIGYVAQTEYTFEQDVCAANEFLDQLQAKAPKARFDYLEGNHERRVEQWCVTSALRNTEDAKFLRRMFGIESVLHLGQRNIAYHALNSYHDGLPVQGAIRRGKCLFVHGASHATHAAKKHLDLFGCNVVFGHIHRAQSFTATPVHTGTIGAWCPGCLCELQMYYMHGKPSGHSHGYHVQYVQPDGQFFPIQIPIINGKSYLDKLIEKVT